MIDKHQARHIALGCGIIGVIAFVLFHKKKPTVIVTSQTPDSQAVAVPSDSFGAPPDFSGLDGQSLPFTSYVPGAYNYDPTAPAVGNYIAPTPDPDPTLNVYPTSNCGC